MHIRSLQLQNFRNLNTVSVSFSPGLNIICGLNAQGKTNLLEAVYLLVTGRSFRTTHDSELIPWNSEDYTGTVIKAEITKAAGNEQIVFFFNGKEKRVHIDGKPLNKLVHLVGQLNAVLFTPSDLLLVRGAPALRRRFLDIAIGQVTPAYLQALQVYQHVLKNRNLLLKNWEPGNAPQLDVYDQQLAWAGATLIIHRKTALSEISDSAAGHYATISSTGESLLLKYEPDTPLSSAAEDQAAAMLQLLTQNRQDDIRRQNTNRGPHRDDFSFRIEDHAARHFASQGQQRSAVLALKLAEMDFLASRTGELPLLMLDDLMSELDENRKAALLQHITDKTQTFITTTDPALVTSFVQAQTLLKITAGQVSGSTLAEYR